MSERVMADLIDALMLERLGGFGDGVVRDGWYHVGELRLRVRAGGPLLPWRYAGGPVLLGRREVSPAELLHLVAVGEPNVAEVSADVATAVEHAAVADHARGHPDDLLHGERLTAARNRPFHPAARAAVGWTAAELAEYGPFRRDPLALAWVEVHADLLRFGSGPDSAGFAAALLGDEDRVPVTPGYRALPVHPWQLAHVLPREFPAELASGAIRPLAAAGAFRPTSSLRTLASPDPRVHVKLPLGIATLGATRLLPPRYLDNGERAERTLREVLDRDAPLRARVALCDERSWCGWAGDEFADRPGHLGAQLRRYPAEVAGTVAMGALAVPEWHSTTTAAEAVPWFSRLAESFCEMALRFLRYGVLPELHGQNVTVTPREPFRFILRDHDTVRFHPQWMAEAAVPEPGYRIKPGARQSLRLDSAEDLVGYFQTLGVQVNLYGIIDALTRHHRIGEDALWTALREAITTCLQRIDLPHLVRDRLLLDPEWPSRQVLSPLLRQGRSAGVSMPASTGRVPNPLLP